jgi:hypothetical protein
VEALLCIPCKEQVVCYPGEKGCPFCGGPVTELGEYIDILRDAQEDREMNAEDSDGADRKDRGEHTDPPKSDG